MIVSMNNLLESGVHYGHQKRRWNPKMREYIYTSRDDIYILNLQKTTEKLQEAYDALKELSTNGGKILYVGTKRQAQEAIETNALRCDNYFVNERWLGGTLTNFRTIKSRISRMEEIEKMEADGVFELLPKKEVLQIRREYDKLNKNLRGIRTMEKLPDALIIVDPIEEATAIKEARSLGIDVFGIVDTNGDPDVLDYPIPANDDAIKSISLLLGVLTNAVAEACGKEVIDYVGDVDDNQEVITQEEYMNRKANQVNKKDNRNFRRDNNRFGFKKDNKISKRKNDKKDLEDVVEDVVESETIEEIKEEVVEVKETKNEDKKESKKEEKKSSNDDLSSLTLAELKEKAKDAGLKGYSTMKKQDLVDALSK